MCINLDFLQETKARRIITKVKIQQKPYNLLLENTLTGYCN